jgi:hypothetical protein
MGFFNAPECQKKSFRRINQAFGTAGTPDALRSCGFLRIPPSAIGHAVPEFIWECRTNPTKQFGAANVTLYMHPA